MLFAIIGSFCLKASHFSIESREWRFPRFIPGQLLPVIFQLLLLLIIDDQNGKDLHWSGLASYTIQPPPKEFRMISSDQKMQSILLFSLRESRLVPLSRGIHRQ